MSTVSVDLDKCEGHGQCVMVAPAYFRLGDDDDVVELLTPDILPEDIASLEHASSLCPAMAITVDR